MYATLNMPNPLSNNLVAAMAPIRRGRVCPRCQGEIYPMKRRWFDRIRGHGSKIYRYECDSYRCSDREHEATGQSVADDIGTATDRVSRGRSCPRCHGETFRVERKLFDLLISRISVVHRYQCDSRKCGWNGLVRQHESAQSPPN